MASFSDYLEQGLLNHVFSLTGAFAQPIISIGLYTVIPTDVAGSGTEVLDSNAYARTADIKGASNWTKSGTTQVANDNNIDFTEATGNWGTVLAMAISDSATYGAGNQLMWSGFTGVAIETGDTARFVAATGVVITLD